VVEKIPNKIRRTEGYGEKKLMVKFTLDLRIVCCKIL